MARIRSGDHGVWLENDSGNLPADNNGDIWGVHFWVHASVLG